MPRPRLHVEVELRKTIRELKQCEQGSETQRRKHVKVDELLDELSTLLGAHPPTCRCEEVCAERLGRFRHLGECLSPEDVAHEGRW